jgi:predicted Zn-dependent peptidase
MISGDQRLALYFLNKLKNNVYLMGATERGFCMNNSFKTRQTKRFPVHICSTAKYKTNFIALYIRQPLHEETYALAALLPHVLTRGTESYPTSAALRKALDDRYGATLTTDVQKRGEEQVIVLRLQMANEKYLQDQTPLLEQGIKLLAEVLLAPVKEGESFHKKFVELEKDLLIRKIEQIKDEKMRYANKRCVEEMFKHELYRLYPYGSVESVQKIEPAQLFNYYQRLLQHLPMEMFVVGDVEEERVLESIDTYFPLPVAEKIQLPPTDAYRVPDQEREVIEKTKITQGKLHIGCRIQTAYADDDYVAMQVCNGVFGGFSHSKLFRHVREKQSLAYYVGSNVESHKGFMMIMSGIEFQNYEKTVQIIKEQLSEMKEGRISENEMNQTKAVLTNQIREANDQPFQMMERMMHGIIAGKIRTSEELIEQIGRVSVEEVQRAAQKIEVDTVYFLTEGNGGAE